MRNRRSHVAVDPRRGAFAHRDLHALRSRCALTGISLALCMLPDLLDLFSQICTLHLYACSTCPSYMREDSPCIGRGQLRICRPVATALAAPISDTIWHVHQVHMCAGVLSFRLEGRSRLRGPGC